jgi:hypothetical protein
MGDAPSCHPGPPPPIAVSCAPEHPSADAPALAELEKSPLLDDGRDPDGGYWRTIRFRNFLIDRIYPSMTGPWTRTYLAGRGRRPGERLWVTRYRAEVLDSRSGTASQEFMCHTNLDLVGATQDGRYANVHSQLSISQGQKEIVFPEGFALRIDVEPNQAIDVSAMVLNNNDADLHRFLDFKVTLNYEDDEGAARRRLIALYQGAVWTSCATQASSAMPGEPVCRSASEPADQRDVSGRLATGHWIVPPGRQVLSNFVAMPVPRDTTVHYIWMHVHPYAESMELRDLTTNRTVFKGRVVNELGRAAVLATDHYSDATGIRVFPDHRYELTTVYNNTSGHDIDAMAALWMYFRSPDLPAKTLASN